MAALRKLNSLQLVGPTLLTDRAIEQLSPDIPLGVIRIDEGHFSSACLKHLEDFTHLNILSLTSDTAFNQKEINRFKRNNPIRQLKLTP